MFRGISALLMDSKGRVAVPTRYHETLQNEAGQMVMTVDTQALCLLLYPLSEWNIIEEKIAALPTLNPAARRIQRLLVGHATDVELDGNGRVLIPPVLREYAQLDKKVMWVGQGKKFEIWSELGWQEERDAWFSDKDQGEGELPAELKQLSL
jgi:MraZ protein